MFDEDEDDIEDNVEDSADLFDRCYQERLDAADKLEKAIADQREEREAALRLERHSEEMEQEPKTT
jgi:hypothetical protein